MKAFDTPNLPTAHRFAIHTLLSKTHSPDSGRFHALALTHSVSDGHLLWGHARKKTLIYQSIFLTISLFFTLLAAFVFQTKIYMSFPFFELPAVTTKFVLIALTLSFGLWAAWLAFKMRPFQEQVAHMEVKAKARLAKFNKSPLSINKGWSMHLIHEAEELMDKAIQETIREELRLKKLNLDRKQRFIQRAFLLESLEKQLEEIFELYKQQAKTILN